MIRPFRTQGEMMPASRPHHRRAAAAAAAALILVTAGCGARLTRAQIAALDSSGSGSGTAAAGASGASAAGGTDSGSGSTASGATGTGTGTGTGAVASGGTGGSGSTGGSAGSTGGVGASGATTGGSTGGTGTASATKTGTSGSSGSGGSSTVTQASNPLAGPGGKVCTSGAPGSGPGVTASQITVGNISTVNGPVPGLFAGARYGAEAVAAYINSAGGICGRKLVVDSADDQFDQATDQNEASSMAGNVLGFMGSFSLQDNGIPAGAPGVPDIGNSLSPQRFSAATNYSPAPTPPGFTTGLFQFYKSSPKYSAATQKMALLVENTPQTATQGQYIQAALKSIGYNFVFTDTTLQPTDPTFNGDVQKMKSAGVQGVVFEATGTIIGQLANAMFQAGINITLGYYCPSAYDPAFIKNAGPGTAGTVIGQQLALYDGEDAGSIPMVATLDQWYARVDPGQVPDLYATYAWMSGLMLAQALNEAGSVSRSALTSGLQSLTSFTGDGLEPPANPAAKTPPSCFVLVDVKNGKFVRDPATPSGFTCSPSGYYHSS